MSGGYTFIDYLKEELFGALLFNLFNFGIEEFFKFIFEPLSLLSPFVWMYKMGTILTSDVSLATALQLTILTHFMLMILIIELFAAIWFGAFALPLLHSFIISTVYSIFLDYLLKSDKENKNQALLEFGIGNFWTYLMKYCYS